MTTKSDEHKTLYRKKLLTNNIDIDGSSVVALFIGQMYTVFA